MIKFNPYLTTHKAPFGALAVLEDININIHVSKALGVSGVFLIVRNDNDEDNFRIKLNIKDSQDIYDIYSITFNLFNAGIYFYRFELKTESGVLFVGKDEDNGAIIGDWLPEWQITVYQRGFKTPDWIKGGLIYHIFPDRFCRVEDGKKPLRGALKKWNEDVTIIDADGVYRANDFYGGNIKGILTKLDYLKQFGVTAIYLSPIYLSSSNHRYDISDYMQIDALFGTEEELQMLICQCQAKGIFLIMDGVFNHTGADSIYFNKFGHFDSLGAYQSKNSKYYDWYTFTDYPNTYDCWWGVTVVPSIKRNSESFQEFIAGDSGVIEKWLKLGIKGWRLDVVDELSSGFVKKITKKVKSMGDNLIIGEVWEDASTKVSYGEKRQYFWGKELDGVMNYPFKDAILNYVKYKNADSFYKQTMQIIENYPKQCLDVSMTLIGTHDTVRAINDLSEVSALNSKAERLNYRLNKKEYELGKKRLKMASSLQYFLPGVPVIYYGDEVGLEGFEDPINRRTLPEKGDKDLLKHYQKLGAIRHEYRELFYGNFNIKAVGDIIQIDRGKLTLIVNPTDKPYKLEKEVFDILTHAHIKEIEENCIIFLN